MIVITAPTSTIGSQLVTRLLDEDEELRLIARDPSKLPADVRERTEVVEGSHSDAAVVDGAFPGADAVFWLVPPDPTATSLEEAYSGFAGPAVEVLGRGDVGRVVGVSALGRGTPQAEHAGHVTATLAMDDRIGATGVPYRALANPSFMDNVARQVVPIRDQGAYTLPGEGDLKLPTCATRDIAAAAAELLRDDSWVGFEETPLLGPEDLSAQDQVTIMTEVLATPIELRRISIDDFRAQLVERGMSEAVAQGMVDMYEAKADGLDLGVERTAINSTPTSFYEWCEQVLKPAVEAA